MKHNNKLRAEGVVAMLMDWQGVHLFPKILMANKNREL